MVSYYVSFVLKDYWNNGCWFEKEFRFESLSDARDKYSELIHLFNSRVNANGEQVKYRVSIVKVFSNNLCTLLSVNGNYNPFIKTNVL